MNEEFEKLKKRIGELEIQMENFERWIKTDLDKMIGWEFGNIKNKMEEQRKELEEIKGYIRRPWWRKLFGID